MPYEILNAQFPGQCIEEIIRKHNSFIFVLVFGRLMTDRCDRMIEIINHLFICSLF